MCRLLAVVSTTLFVHFVFLLAGQRFVRSMSRRLVLCAMCIGESEWSLIFASMVLVLLNFCRRWVTLGTVVCSALVMQGGRYFLIDF